MTEKCFEIGTIQAFLDGELDNDSLAQVAHHISVCDDCAMLLAETENESAFAFAALNSELNSLVPTERIRTNLYEAIAAEKKSFWQRIFGGKFSLMNPSVAAFASLILVVGIFVTLFIVRENRTARTDEIAQVEKTKSVETPVKVNPQPAVPTISADENQTTSSDTVQVKSADLKSTLRTATIQNADYKIKKSPTKNQLPKVENKNVDNTAAQPVKNENLAGEDSYIKTIATLSETVNSRKDEVLRPSARVAFEKDLAIVDDSITKMQKEVRSNPNNEAAKQLLRSSYQNKIDLLNSVADKNDLMATLK